MNPKDSHLNDGYLLKRRRESLKKMTVVFKKEDRYYLKK